MTIINKDFFNPSNVPFHDWVWLFFSGQLRISLVDGLQEQGSQMIDRPVFFGGRGISMFKVNPYGLDLVWDSGDSISKGVQDLHPNAFNHPPFGNQEVMEEVVIPSNLINRRWDSWSPFMVILH